MMHVSRIEEELVIESHYSESAKLPQMVRSEAEYVHKQTSSRNAKLFKAPKMLR